MQRYKNTDAAVLLMLNRFCGIMPALFSHVKFVMDTLLDQLDDNLKELYRKALDADALLDNLQQQGHAKHQRIFADHALFQASSNRFMPYLAETAEQVAAMRQSQQFNTATLQRVVKQMKQLHQTLAEFRTVITK